MTDRTAVDDELLEIPINLAGLLKIRVPGHLNPEEFRSRALAQFKKLLGTQYEMGESCEATFAYEGDAWSLCDQVQAADRLFDVQHDLSMNVTGASVALRPRPGEFGENRYRGRIGAYVSEFDVFVTARCPTTDAERVLVNVRMEDGNPTVHVMDASSPESADSAGQAPLVSVPFFNLAFALN